MELLIRIVNKPQDGWKHVKGHGRMEAGDVIWAMPDGHDWSREERTNPEWRIVRVALRQSEVSALLASSPGDDRGQLGRLHKRQTRVDLRKLPTLNPKTITTINPAVFRAACGIKAPLGMVP